MTQDVLMLIIHSLFIWNSNLTGHPVFLFAKSCNPQNESVIPQSKTSVRIL